MITCSNVARSGVLMFWIERMTLLYGSTRAREDLALHEPKDTTYLPASKPARRNEYPDDDTTTPPTGTM